MAFSFNFDIPLQTQEDCDGDAKDGVKDGNEDHFEHEASVAVQKEVKEAVEHRYKSDSLSYIENSVTETLTIGALPPLHYINESVFEKTAAEREDSEKILAKTEAQNSDLITGVYEGGLKIWECTYDLMQYLDEEGETFCGKSVLDLGCGAGILGILALKRRARTVQFQDYNFTVIEQLTMPNVFLNCEEDDSSEDDDAGKKDGPPLKKRALDTSDLSLSARCSFFSGDWTSYLLLIQSRDPKPKFDIIFTSETIYNPEYYMSLHNVLHELLNDDGVVYLATKSHYFGVGGGLYLFKSFVEEKGVFQIQYLKDFDKGLKRHIVSLRFKKSSV